MKRYSYLNIPYGFETNYRETQIVTPKNAQWTIYRCMRFDCVESERFVALRQYTNNRLMADTLEKVLNKVWDWEYF